jgi:glucokinase
MYLAGDIGGTNTRLSLFEEGLNIVREHKYPSGEYGTLREIILEFVGNDRVQKACIGIAGPVRDNVCHATNLPWVVDAKKLQQDLHGAPVVLINDLVANAYGIKTLPLNQFAIINEGAGGGNQALISAGTGLGEAGIYFDGKKHHPFPSEGGHADFAPRNEEEIDLFRHLQKKFGHVSYERVVSGPGIYNLYSYAEGKEIDIVPSEITRRGADGSCKKCEQALDWFVTFYGAEVGNAALKYLATGGVYLGGGIAPAIVEKLKSPLFMDAFLDKGRFKDLLSQIPIWVVLNDNTALLGSAYYARELIK